MRFNGLLIANRGEIAIRIAGAGADLGLRVPCSQFSEHTPPA